MARQPRNEIKPGVYHVFARGNNRELIFLDDDDRRAYLLRLRLVADEMGWRLLSYCLMGNHIHLLVETRRPNLGHGIRLLHGGYAQEFNRNHGRTGHLFGERFGSVTIESDEHFRTAARYIARNPVEAGLVAKPGGWRWDSWRAITAPGRLDFVDVKRLLDRFAPGGGSGALARFLVYAFSERAP
jgi:REP element-mobilizing transposase RayT